MRMKMNLHTMIDEHGLTNVLDWIDELACERLNDSTDPLVNEFQNSMDKLIAIAEKVDDAGLIPQISTYR